MDRDELRRCALPVLVRHTGVSAAILFGDVDIAVVGAEAIETVDPRVFHHAGAETDLPDHRRMVGPLGGG